MHVLHYILEPREGSIPSYLMESLGKGQARLAAFPCRSRGRSRHYGYRFRVSVTAMFVYVYDEDDEWGKEKTMNPRRGIQSREVRAVITGELDLGGATGAHFGIRT